MKRELPQLLAFFTGTLIVLAYFIPQSFFKTLQETFSNYSSIVLAFSIYLALASLLGIHGEKISRREEGYGYSVVLLVSFIVTTGYGVFFGVQPYYDDYVVLSDPSMKTTLLAASKSLNACKLLEDKVRVIQGLSPETWAQLGVTREATMAKILEDLSESSFSTPSAGPHAGQTVLKVEYYNMYDWIFEYVYQPLMATMFSILAFYVATAAFRAFRARTIEGTMLLVAAAFVMVGRVGVGAWLTQKIHIIDFPWIQEWIMSVPNIAGQRAITIGTALGVVSASLRMLLGIEQTYLGTD